MYISSIFTIAVRGTGAFFGILVTILSARALSIEEAGDFLFCLTIIQSLGGVLCLGTYTAAVKVSASSSELGWHAVGCLCADFCCLPRDLLLVLDGRNN